MASSLQEYHLLRVEDANGGRTYCLDAATISIGRDGSNTIQINDSFASRHHALLLRMPSNTYQYSFQIVDGDVNGNPSKNGVWINQNFCQSKRLITGDHIQLGETHISYLIAIMTPEECKQYFEIESITFHSLKEEVLDPTGTLVSELIAAA